MNLDITAHIQLIEVVWTFVAMYGTIYASRNLVEGYKDYRIAKQAFDVLPKPTRAAVARVEWAEFFHGLHMKLAGMGAVFAFVGLISMTRRPSPDADSATSVVLGVLLTLAGYIVASVSHKWRVMQKKRRGER